LRDAIVGCFQKDKQKKIAQVFQAFRIATNRELEDIQKLCSLLPKKLAKNGLSLFITFHSI
jgi:16S rRNA C1402 N4-methylase RsmH